MSLIFEGLDELREALRQMPETGAGEAQHIVEANANGAEQQIKAAYGEHVVTGNLQAHVTSSRLTSRWGALATIRNTAKHAWIFEHGTQARHYVTRNGVQHLTGRMPPFHIFVPIMMKARRRVYSELKDLLVRMGFEVNGDELG